LSFIQILRKLLQPTIWNRQK